MNVFKRAWLWLRMTRRVGVYAHGLKHGLSHEDAVTYMNRQLPPTDDDLAYGDMLQRRQREKAKRQ